ncbi:MAG TPA: hypothetical protein VK509_13920 [Polyangiales bacterium]|nr:hypothetical protein [Polyangiales bacterium]
MTLAVLGFSSMLVVTGGAVAQADLPTEAAPPVDPPPQAADEPADAGAEQGTQRAGLEEIVVTARRRKEKAQQTPISMTVLSNDALRERGIVDVSLRVSPSFVRIT